MKYKYEMLSLFLFNTVTSHYLHGFLLIIGSYPIALSLALSYYKVKDYSKGLNPFNNSFLSFFLDINPLKFVFNRKTDSFQIILLILLTLLLLLFYLIRNIKCTQKVVINFYDLLFFRYGAFYIFGIYFSIYYNTDNIIVKIIDISILFLYFITIIIHVINAKNILTIENKNTRKCVNYPFTGGLSLKIEIGNIILKVFCSFEYFYFIQKLTKFQALVAVSNIAILIISLFLFICVLITYLPSTSTYNEFYFITEITLFKSIVIISYFYILTLLFFFNQTSKELVLCIIVISFIWGIISMYFIWTKFALVKCYKNESSYSKLIYLLSRDYDDKNIFFSLDYQIILCSYENAHQINC